MTNNMRTPVLGTLLQTIAPRIGATVTMEPVWGIAGRITFENGAHSYFRYNTLDINPSGASEIARDKDYANFFIEELGYPIVPGSKAFYSDSWAETIGAPDRTGTTGVKHAKALGFPVIVKPNSGSQGTGVSLVYNEKEFIGALRSIFETDRIALVQKYVSGKDYRLVVLDDKLVTAYERIPLNIVGDGTSTIAELLQKKQDDLRAVGREVRLKAEDPRIQARLVHLGLSPDSIPPSEERIFLLENANLSTGGDAVDVIEHVHPAFKDLAVRLTRDLGLRLCGVDLIINGDIADAPQNYCVLEINASPGLDHYSKLGTMQQKIVEDLYLEVLKKIEDGSN